MPQDLLVSDMPSLAGSWIDLQAEAKQQLKSSFAALAAQFAILRVKACRVVAAREGLRWNVHIQKTAKRLPARSQMVGQ